MFQGPAINQFSLESLIIGKNVLTIIHVATYISCVFIKTLRMRTPQLFRSRISHEGKGTPDRKRKLGGGRKTCVEKRVSGRELS